jgi:hypothetical protein
MGPRGSDLLAGETGCHESDHGGVDHRVGVCGLALVVASETEAARRLADGLEDGAGCPYLSGSRTRTTDGVITRLPNCPPC